MGLGNIWKFPGRACEGGGGSFLVIYLLIVLFLGVPLMLTELSMGRASQSNIVGVFGKLGHRKCAWIGWIGVAGAFVITCYYCHVGGWVLRYVFGYAILLYLAVLVLQVCVQTLECRMIEKLNGIRMQDADIVNAIRVLTLAGCGVAAVFAFICPAASIWIVVFASLVSVVLIVRYDRRISD